MPKSIILCVDDEPIVLTSLKEQLKRRFGRQYMYETAQNPVEALQIIEELIEDEIEVSLVIADWLMPDMKGDEFLIQVHEKCPKTVTIMLTGQADTDAVERAKLKANLHRCLSKPWTEDELVAVVLSGLE
ncbi:response regulator [Lusitaniella coriacea LEGE 07157]|uniref:Response regulator n=1 Tax=Lusitaniella coriacea LEGE 07157 TaxID=945747 RepID=A0A8J7JCX7_9CYAN|nr:response regulator [Lusitaniella coriacea]MBE9117955.1 response regulator [Lusitaniella coriacea LEGE 07157]